MNKLILFPLPKEKHHFLQGLTQTKYEHCSLLSTPDLQVHRIPEWGAFLAIGGHGKAQFGIQAQSYIYQMQTIQHLFCVGAGGGISENINIFDIVVGTETIEHDYMEKFDPTEPLPAFQNHPISYPDFLPLNIHSGIIASGDEDIVDAQRAKELHQKTKALIVAWEGAGGARAARFNKLLFTEIRIATDNACQHAPQDFSKNLPIAMGKIALFFENIFS